MEHTLQLREVSRRYARMPVLTGLFYTFFPDRIYSLTGESGVGKSTLVRILAGLDRGYQGSVLWNGRDLAQCTGQELARFRQNDLGIQLQNPVLVPSLTGIDNVALPLLLQGQPVAESRKLAASALQPFGLGEAAARRVEKMSGGEKRRTAIACALIRQPRLLILDEPTGDLDARHENQVLELLGEYRSRTRACILLVTHSSAATRIADTRLTLVRTAEGGRLYER